MTVTTDRPLDVTVHAEHDDSGSRQETLAARGTAWLDALLYDWHNTHLLCRQRADETFYPRVLAGRKAVLVLGAGTGRVAVPLARRSAGTVFAVDRSTCRLHRVAHADCLIPVGADIRELPFTRNVADAVLYPYSTFQLLGSQDDRSAALRDARRVLREDGVLLVDVSTNFDNHPAGRRRRVALEAHCPELGAVVTEVEESAPAQDHLVITRRFSSDGRPLAEIGERWFFASAVDLPEILPGAGFHVERVLCGYGDAETEHRSIYVARPA